MKTITMDFETYENELDKARKEGFEIVSDLSKHLRELIRVHNSLVSQDEFFKAIRPFDRAMEQLLRGAKP